MVATPCSLHSGTDLGAMESDEDYQSPFDFAAGVNTEYLYLSPRGHLSPPGSPVPQRLGNHKCLSSHGCTEAGAHVGLAWL